MKLSEAQIKLLGLVHNIKSEEEANDICRLIQKYYVEKLDEEIDRLWANGTLSEEKLEAMSKEHFRVPSRKRD